jgi:hypothetical protein
VGDQVDVVLGIPALVMDEDRLICLLAEQQAFAERRPFVRPVLLLAHQHDVSGRILPLSVSARPWLLPVRLRR